MQTLSPLYNLWLFYKLIPGSDNLLIGFARTWEELLSIYCFLKPLSGLPPQLQILMTKANKIEKELWPESTWITFTCSGTDQDLCYESLIFAAVNESLECNEVIGVKWGRDVKEEAGVMSVWVNSRERVVLNTLRERISKILRVSSQVWTQDSAREDE